MKKLIKYIIVLAFVLGHLHAPAQVMGAELIKDGNKTEISFDYTYGFILVKVRINNLLPLNFILDTGAEHIILFKKEIADVFGFGYQKRIQLIGSDLDTPVYALISRNIPLQLEGTQTVTRDIIVLENDFLNLESMVGEPIDGILGSRFFRGLILDIDYRKQKVRLHIKDNYTPPENDYCELDIEVENHKPYLNTTVTTVEGKEVKVKLLLDTGSALPFLLFLNTHPSLSLPDKFIKGNLGRGLGGDLEGYLGKVKHLKINDELYFSNIVTSFQNVDHSLDQELISHRNGLVGNPILARFHVIMDLMAGKMYLKPHKNYNKEFEYDKSGLILYAFGPRLDQYYVKDVIENSPAAEADIRKGDLLKKVGILPAHFFSLNSISKKLQKKEGKKIRLTLLRNGKKLRKTIVLRDLIED